MDFSKKRELEDSGQGESAKRIALWQNGVDELCDRCRVIDWAQLKENAPLSRSGKMVVTISDPRDVLRRSRCRVCRLLALLTPEPLRSEFCQLKAFSSRISFAYLKRTTPRGPLPPSGDIPECTVLYTIGAKTDQSFRRGWHQTGCLVLTNSDNENIDCGPREILPHKVDYKLISQWIAGCNHRHSKTCVRPSGLFPGHLRVIDCQTRNVILAPKMCKYIALSYVWGPAPNKSEDKQGFSPVVEDSITVTLALGFRYLWVDKHCIDQDGPDKQEQIERMDLIYSQAELTIVAAAGDAASYGLPGVSQTDRKPQERINVGGVTLNYVPPHTSHLIRSSTWATRGWTYQESILSRRRLIFTEYQVSFVCNVWHQAESIDVPPESIVGIEDNPFVGFVPKSVRPMRKRYMNVENLTDYQEIKTHIMEYSSRKLTHDSDALNAILSIFESTQAVKRGLAWPEGQYRLFSHMHGLPIKLSPPPSSALLPLGWYHNETARRRANFPSWSWTGWEGAVRMTDPDVYLPEDCLIEVLEENHPVSLANYVKDVMSQSQVKHSTPSTELLITARTVPINLQTKTWGDLNESFSQESRKDSVRFLDGLHSKLHIKEGVWAYVYAYMDEIPLSNDGLLGAILGGRTGDKCLGMLLLRPIEDGYERIGILRYRDGRGTEAGGGRLPHIVYVDEADNLLDDIGSAATNPLWLEGAEIQTVKVA